MKALSIHVRYLRSGPEVFTKSTLEHETAFSQIVESLRARGFPVNVARFELTNTVCLTVKTKSDRGAKYAEDMIRRAGKKAGFHFPFSTEHKA